MIRIGITGSIAMGKSTIANVFKYLSVPVHDSDLIVKDLLEKNISIFKKIANNWPGVINNKRFINKQRLRKIVFSNKKDKIKLEKILHPMVKRDRIEFEKKYNEYKILAFDVRLLYETNQEKTFDYIFLAKCSKETQIKRAMTRKNLDLTTFNKINSNQYSVEKKISYNPIIINTEYPKFFVFFNIILKLIIIKIKRKYI